MTRKVPGYYRHTACVKVFKVKLRISDQLPLSYQQFLFHVLFVFQTEEVQCSGQQKAERPICPVLRSSGREQEIQEMLDLASGVTRSHHRLKVFN